METIIHADGWRGYNELVGLGDKNTLESVMGRRSLLEDRPILTVLKPSGVRLKPVWQSSVELGGNRFILILRIDI